MFAARLNKVRALKRRLQTSLRHCPSLDVRAALHILALFRSGKQGHPGLATCTLFKLGDKQVKAFRSVFLPHLRLITSLIKLAEEDIETAAIADEKAG